MTQQNAAERLNITPQAVSKWERCESMPDITLLPEIAKMYGITVEDILTAGTAGDSGDFTGIVQALNAFIDDRLFEKVRREFESARSVNELNVPLDFFMALNPRQKDILLTLLLEIEGYGTVIDDILQYLNISQRARLITRVAENGDYDVLETLIPFMTRTVRTEIVTLLLKRKEFDFLEEMLIYLNHEQKDIIIRYFIENELNFETFTGFIPLLDKKPDKYKNEEENQ